MSRAMRRLQVVLPGTIERDSGDLPGADDAIRRLLASHPQAPGLLAEARHREVVARASEAEASRQARAGRNAELACELARRRKDPRAARTVRFVPAALSLLALLGGCAAAGLALCWGLPWRDRIALACATVVVSGALAWAGSQRRARGGAWGVLAAALALWCVLEALRILTSGGTVLIRVGEALALGLALAAGVLAMIGIAERSESWQCWRLRWAADRAAKRREDSFRQASLDRDAAGAALAAWESLVVEECRLAHPAGASGDWAQDCLAVARQAAIPA